MSEHITHVAICDDCIRLALHSPKICQPFKQVLNDHIDLARMGSFTRGGDRVTVQVLDYCRQRWPKRQPGNMVEEKLAFALGWRGHNAADRQFKPVYRQVEPEYYAKADAAAGGGDPDMDAPSDSRIYHDTIVFNEVFRGGRDKPFSPHLLEYRLQSHPAARGLAIEHLEDLLGGLLQRSLFELQSLPAGEGNARKRLAVSPRRYQPFTVDVHRMSRAFYSPDAEKLRRFTIENDFYDRVNPIIVLARSIQRGAPDQRINLDQALQAAESQSGYAQAVRKGYLYLLASSEYFERRIGDEELRERLDLAKPHVG